MIYMYYLCSFNVIYRASILYEMLFLVIVVVYLQVEFCSIT